MLSGWGFVEGQDSWHSLVPQGNTTYECYVDVCTCACVYVCVQDLASKEHESQKIPLFCPAPVSLSIALVEYCPWCGQTLRSRKHRLGALAAELWAYSCGVEVF